MQGSVDCGVGTEWNCDYPDCENCDNCRDDEDCPKEDWTPPTRKQMLLFKLHQLRHRITWWWRDLWKPLRYKVALWVDRYPDTCWASLVSYAEGYETFWDEAFWMGNGSNCQTQAYPYCGKCALTGRYKFASESERDAELAQLRAGKQHYSRHTWAEVRRWLP